MPGLTNPPILRAHDGVMVAFVLPPDVATALADGMARALGGGR